jgi:hypothetical protein
MGLAAGQRLGSGSTDMFGGWEIGIATTQVNDIESLLAQRASTVRDRECRGRLKRLNAFGESDVHSGQTPSISADILRGVPYQEERRSGRMGPLPSSRPERQPVSNRRLVLRQKP